MGATQTIPVDEAESDFRGILERVEHGETVVITRDGRSIARLTPGASRFEELDRRVDPEQVQRAFAAIAEIRKHTKPVSLEEILSARDEGRR
jgi:prevent-host-death family protein